MPSLKHFHILFVCGSIALCVFLAYWSYNQNLLSYFILSSISISILIFYGLIFYNKVKFF